MDQTGALRAPVFLPVCFSLTVCIELVAVYAGLYIHLRFLSPVLRSNPMMSFKPVFILFLPFMLLSAYATAGCNKEDIQFYLDKGFTQEQITQLCGTSDSESSVPDYKPYQQQVIIYKEGAEPDIVDGFTRDERTAIKDLKLGADVTDLIVDQDKLQFTIRLCLAVQEGKEYNQRFKTCPEVFYDVARAGLTINASGKKFGFFGQPAIQIVGNIKSTPKQNFDDYPTQFKKQLKRHYDWKTRGNKVNVPIRGDFSVTRLFNALNVLAKEADPNAALAKNEVDDKPEKKIQKSEPEKKKRWWNPFD